MDNVPKSEDWEHKLEVKEYLKKYKFYNEGTKAWTENKGKCYYLILQHCPPELKTELKNSAQWAADTNGVALLLIIRDVMHNKKERAQSTIGLVESDTTLFNNPVGSKDTLDEYY